MKIRVNNGKRVPFIVDTGTVVTTVDQSLESQLGLQWGNSMLLTFHGNYKVKRYAAPKLYLGDTLLFDESNFVLSANVAQATQNTETPAMGILGLDVLANYCIQLDFARHRVRFLDYQSADKKDWGKSFELLKKPSGYFIIAENLVGATGVGSVIDTGYSGYGLLTSELYMRWAQNAVKPAKGEARYPDVVLGGEDYPDVHLVESGHNYGERYLGLNNIGLGFLRRNVVTLDFPEQKIYFKRID